MQNEIPLATEVFRDLKSGATSLGEKTSSFAEKYKDTVNADKIQFILINELNKLLRGLWYENAVVTPKSFLHYLQILSVKLTFKTIS